jgi:hypothetical protein|tara:strand:+ start:1243 stop:1455 length:213 start_codon:yes stop_codon:yes gene_type:complete
MKNIKSFFVRACQIMLIIAVLAFILALTFFGGYFMVTSFSLDVLLFILGVASFSIGIMFLDFIRNEALKK